MNATVQKRIVVPGKLTEPKYSMSEMKVVVNSVNLVICRLLFVVWCQTLYM